VLVVLVFLPLAAVSDQLPAPLEKNLLPGVTVIQYADQTLRFTTSVPLQVSFLALDEDRIQLRFRARGGQYGGDGSAPSSSDLQIFWEDWDNDIYCGVVPPDWWTEVLLTESGFTEK
jgi:hypothetical protein